MNLKGGAAPNGKIEELTMKRISLLNQHRPLARAWVVFAAALALTPALPAFAAAITGMVTNGTTQKPSAGDSVTLIALAQRMQEIAHTKTDSKGHFSIDSPDPGMHLIRVDHQGAAYFQPAPPNTPVVNVDVFDVAAAVAGVTTEANVLRVETDQQGLRVTQSIFVKNESTPPRTQFSSHSYEIYLPPDAQIEGSAAMGPGGMPVQSSPMPLGDKGHYAFLFPIRPGETQFQISYHLPYSGSLKFTPRLATPEANFVVMLPKSMTFTPDAGASFQPVDQPAGVQTFLSRNVTPAQSVAFTVSGSGAMPRETQNAEGEANQAGAAQGAEAPGGASTDTRPGIGLGTPIDTPDPLNKYKWWILGGLALLFAIAAGFFLRKPADAAPGDSSDALPLGDRLKAPLAGSPAPGAAISGPRNTLLAALKDELFAIETDRVQGRLSDSEYVELKSALELVLRRALSRQPA
ncbi:MAG TPA: carboxypeptidase regulatory-like domain-containing protein [Acidobacteriaceae bacterium]|nr:carboxypeptidase regulatory-like domain-containing protein [Acidobacteriaceae bacterium]